MAILMIDWVCPWCGHHQRIMAKHPIKLECQSPTCRFIGFAHEAKHTFWAPTLIEIRTYVSNKLRQYLTESNKFLESGDIEMADFYNQRALEVQENFL